MASELTKFYICHDTIDIFVEQMCYLQRLFVSNISFAGTSQHDCLGLLSQGHDGLQPGAAASVAVHECRKLTARVTQTRPQHPRITQEARRW